MKVHLFFILALCKCSVAMASDVAVCGPEPLRAVQKFQRSVNTQDEWLTDPTLIINPDLSEVKGFAVRYWKCVEKTVVPMTDSERVQVDLPTPEELLAKQRQERVVILRTAFQNDVGRWDAMTSQEKDGVMKNLLEHQALTVELTQR